jgi:hypothetical protein
MSFVYVIGESESGPVKIGRTKSLEQRLASLQVGNHRRLQVLASSNCPRPASVEASLHDRFRSKRLTGEWFSVDAATAANALAELTHANQAATGLNVEFVVLCDEETLVDRLARFLIALADTDEPESTQQEAVA